MSHRRLPCSRTLLRRPKVNNPRLVALAANVRLDAFAKVKKAMDEMVVQFLKEQEDEIKHKD